MSQRFIMQDLFVDHHLVTLEKIISRMKSRHMTTYKNDPAEEDLNQTRCNHDTSKNTHHT